MIAHVNPATGELRHQPALDRTGRQIAPSSARPEPVIPQQPLQLGSGEVRIRHQAGVLPQHPFEPRLT